MTEQAKSWWMSLSHLNSPIMHTWRTGILLSCKRNGNVWWQSDQPKQVKDGYQGCHGMLLHLYYHQLYTKFPHHASPGYNWHRPRTWKTLAFGLVHLWLIWKSPQYTRIFCPIIICDSLLNVTWFLCSWKVHLCLSKHHDNLFFFFPTRTTFF